MLSGKGLCHELITRPEESYRLCCVVVCDLETSRIGAPYIYDTSSLRVKYQCWDSFRSSGLCKGLFPNIGVTVKCSDREVNRQMLQSSSTKPVLNIRFIRGDNVAVSFAV